MRVSVLLAAGLATTSACTGGETQRIVVDRQALGEAQGDEPTAEVPASLAASEPLARPTASTAWWRSSPPIS